MTQKIYPAIFKLDTKGKTRIWYMQQDGERYRTYAGIDGGNLVESEWTRAEPTNVGRSNERDAVAQATFEIEAAYEKKLTREYHRTVEAAQGGAHFFKPMLAQKYDKFAPGVVQPKLDGVRCIATKDGLFSREGKPLPGAPHIVEALARVFERRPDLVLDGELYNHDLRDNFNEVISLVKKANPSPERLEQIRSMVQYHVYDLPTHAGPVMERVKIAAALVGALENPALTAVETRQVETEAEFDALHGEWLEKGFEGSMWRCPTTPYEQKRSKSLRKRKEFLDEEFEVVAIEEGQGNWSGLAKRVVCRLPDGRTFGAGIKGNQQRAKELLGETHKVVTIRFFAYTPDGVPRFPVATKFWGAERDL